MSETNLQDKEKIDIREPSNYKVILMNDDYTSMDFVVGILTSIFHKSEPEAEIITKSIHDKGSGVAGIFSKEIAEMKAHLTSEEAQKSEFPFQVNIEEE